MKYLKIPGIIVGSFVGVFALIFFLYPQINPEQYEQLTQWDEQDGDGFPGAGPLTDEEVEEWKAEMERLRADNRSLRSTVDSLQLLNEDLELELKEWEKLEDFMPVAESATEPVQRGSTFYMSDEEFGERVKSLLNLDEEELAPIIREMDDGQLVRLYQSGGTIQREKLLRSLSPQRAAKLMSEVML
ncbi:hypothetical protein QA596_04640 [Balneolales bacterium ANBcel1]|nr:hypothetical protein [Balneolales bacterium ANBcel1]